MSWYAYLIVALLALSGALNILNIGKEREPTTPGAALAVCVVNAAFIWGVVELSIR